MTVETTDLKDLLIIGFDKHEDLRGSFTKPFNSESFAQLGLVTEFKEYYFSQSHKNVIRGMHYQKPPFQYTKLIFVNHGAILDVILDVRPDSRTYGNYIVVELKSKDPIAILIPPGFAHGYLSLTNEATISYLQSSVYNAAADTGVRFDSFNFNWPCIDPIVSDRDLSLPIFNKTVLV